MAKVHLDTGLFGRAACGKQNVDTTKDPLEVTCRSCQVTAVYGVEASVAEEQAGIVATP